MFVWSRDQARKLLTQRSISDSTSDLREDISHRGGSDEITSLVTRQRASEENKYTETPFQSRSCPKIATDGATESSDHECILSIYPEDTVPIADINPVLSAQEPEEWWANKTILDLGAGDGHVTQILAESAWKIYVTETSAIMRKRLISKGYTILNVDSWTVEVNDGYFDLVSCLNLLDRCNTPLTLLKDIYRKLAPEGRLVIALVLPISPYVETGTSDHEPSENMDIKGDTIEQQVNNLIEDVFPSLGFKTLKWTRLPYLCEGDMDQAFYWLSDIVFILKKVENNP